MNEKICPIMGRPCCGVKDCAPAVMKAEIIDEQNGVIEGTDRKTDPICPIVNLTSSLDQMAAGFSILMMGVMQSEQPAETQSLSEDEQKAKAAYEERRAVILKSTGVDIAKLPPDEPPPNGIPT